MLEPISFVNHTTKVAAFDGLGSLKFTNHHNPKVCVSWTLILETV